MLLLRLLLTLIIAGSLTLPLQAITITVADSGADYTSIQAAIDAANNGDEIIVSPGTYLENINFNGKAITLRSASGDPADTIIDGGGSDTVVTCDSGETSTTVLDGFTITNGSATYAGGIENDFSSPTVSNCTFSGNTTNDEGGGMLNYDNSSPTVTNCILSGNSALQGSEIENDSSSITVSHSCIQGGYLGLANIDTDPLFVDADGPDNTAGTEDDNLRLSGGSPCIDAGNGFLASVFPFDLGGNDRYVDEPMTINTGSGVLMFLHMGAHEFQVPPCSALPGDINCNGIVNLLALHWLETI